MASSFGKVRTQVTQRCGSIWMRKFSSAGLSSLKSDKPHVIRQLTCFHDMHLALKKWMHSELFAEKTKLFNEVVPGRLIRAEDIAIGPKVIQSLIGTKSLRQGISLVAVNLMNGRNISHLLTPDNVLFSEEGDILLRQTHLPGEEELEGTENNHVAFTALHDLFFGKSGIAGLLAKSAEKSGRILVNEDLSLDLIDLRDKLSNSALTDKRLITNHQAQMYPDEIVQLILLVNQFTWNEAACSPDQSYRRRCTGKIFRALGKLVPNGLYGMHPMFDYWLNHGKNLGRLIHAMDGGLVASTPESPPNDYFHGLALVSMMRTSVLHPFGPWRARSKIENNSQYTKEYLEAIVPVGGEYTFQEVQGLTRYKLPMFGPTSHLKFLECELDKKIEVNQHSKPPYLKWTDIVTPWPGRTILIPSRSY